jgi:hypothetical protein
MRAAQTKAGQTAGSGRAALRARVTLVTPSRAWVTRRSLRRSTASATDPPTSDIVIRGRREARPIMPTASDDRVST